MQKKNSAASASPKPRRSRKQPSAPQLTVALDAEASAQVRALAVALEEDPRDVTCGMLAEYVPGALSSLIRQRDHDRAAGRKWIEDEWRVAEDAINAARRRRNRREKAGDVSARAHSLRVTFAGLQEIADAEEVAGVLESCGVLMDHIQVQLRALNHSA